MAVAFDSSSFVQKFGCGRRKPDDPFFQSGDTVCSMRFREGIVEYGFEEYEFVRERKEFPCTIPTCRIVSHSPADFEAHFNSCHRFICSECKKSLPSPHLLDLHLHEIHSAFFSVQAERKPMEFPCTIPTCRIVSHSPADFEAHFNSCHRFICSECKKSLPSPHLLDLHLHEIHSAFFSVQAERKPMYKCFVEACDIVSLTPKERHDHCIDVHKFPHNYRFDKGTGKPGKFNKFTKNTNTDANQKKPDKDANQKKPDKDANQKKPDEEDIKDSTTNEKEPSQKTSDKDSLKNTSVNEKKPSHTFSFGHAAAHNHKFIPRSLAVAKEPNKQKKAKNQVRRDKKVECKNEIKTEEMMEVKTDETMEVKDEIKPDETMEDKNEIKPDETMEDKNEIKPDEMMEVTD